MVTKNYYIKGIYLTIFLSYLVIFTRCIINYISLSDNETEKEITFKTISLLGFIYSHITYFYYSDYKKKLYPLLSYQVSILLFFCFISFAFYISENIFQKHTYILNILYIILWGAFATTLGGHIWYIYHMLFTKINNKPYVLSALLSINKESIKLYIFAAIFSLVFTSPSPGKTGNSLESIFYVVGIFICLFTFNKRIEKLWK